MTNVYNFIQNIGQKRALPDFSDVTGMSEVKSVLNMAIIQPFKNPELFKSMDIASGGKFILFGPPGCGKTFISLAVAGEAGASLFKMTPSNTWGEESVNAETAVAKIFNEARGSLPSVITLDEAETLLVDRSHYEGHPWSYKVINEMLTQLDDSTSENKGILLLATTNAPWLLDSAAIRYGRFERSIFIPPPSIEVREEFFTKRLTGLEGFSEFKEELLAQTKDYSFADMEGLLKRTKVKGMELYLAEKGGLEEGVCFLNIQKLQEEVTTYASSVELWFQKVREKSDSMPKEMVGQIQAYLSLK
jgi:SpoVK/Ycf46/Vps4 family AAA+-type ATPase